MLLVFAAVPAGWDVALGWGGVADWAVTIGWGAAAGWDIAVACDAPVDCEMAVDWGEPAARGTAAESVACAPAVTVNAQSVAERNGTERWSIGRLILPTAASCA
jgi:hypothetical protein